MNPDSPILCINCRAAPVSDGCGFSVLCKNCTLSSYAITRQRLGFEKCANLLCTKKIVDFHRCNTVAGPGDPAFAVTPHGRIIVLPYCTYCNAVSGTKILHERQARHILSRVFDKPKEKRDVHGSIRMKPKRSVERSKRPPSSKTKESDRAKMKIEPVIFSTIEELESDIEPKEAEPTPWYPVKSSGIGR